MSVTTVEPPATRGLWARIPYGLKAKVAVGLLLLLFWELGVRTFAAAYVARPSTVVPVIPDVLTSRQFIEAFVGTMIPFLQGLVVATVAAVLVGLAMGQIAWLGWALKGYTYALFALPMVAVVPLVTMWAGYSNTSRMAIIVFAAYFPMVLNVYDGARSVPQRYLEVAKTYRAPRRAVWFGVVVPASIPYLLAGFRLAAGRAIVAAVVAEYLISIPGLGFYILVNARTFRHNEAFVAVIALALVGILTLLLARWAAGALAPWYDADRED